MAFQTGVTTSIENLLQTLSTFLQANGWTEDFATTGDPGRIAFSKNSMFIAISYSETGGSPAGIMNLYPNTSNDNSAQVWNSTGDSGGSNLTNTPNTGNLNVNNIGGPHTAYWFFENDANPAYIHVVVEVDTGRFRHFGWGELDKFGDWAGGEYYYGHFWSQGFEIDAPDNTNHNLGLDGIGSIESRKPFVRAPGLPDLTGPEEWLIIGNADVGPNGVDRAGNDRYSGSGTGRRGISHAFTAIEFDRFQAFKPLIPMPVWFTNTSTTPDILKLLGTQPDVRQLNIANLDPGEIITVAGEDWYIFPWVRKQFLQLNTEESWNAGYAYRRENA